MPCELIERMAACDDCRNLAVDYGMYLIGSRRYNADPRHWGLHLTTTRIHLDNHLITAHAAWLPDRQPDCGTCEAWREDHNARCRLGANFPCRPAAGRCPAVPAPCTSSASPAAAGLTGHRSRRNPLASRDPNRPNVLLILSDDQGQWAMGCAGNDEIHTPHLDGLADRGIHFSRFFCTSPVCSPARASLFTGELPSQHGVHDWLAYHHAGRTGVDFLSGRTLFTDLLADVGYRLGLSGKWHLGANDRPRRGFLIIQPGGQFSAFGRVGRLVDQVALLAGHAGP